MTIVTTDTDHVTCEADQRAIVLPPAAITEATQLQRQTGDLFALEGTATENRAKLHFDIFNYVERYDRDAVEELARDNEFSSTSKALNCHLLAQFLTGINVNEKGISQAEKASRQTRVRPFALVLEGLRKRRSEHAHLEFDAWLKWYLREGQQVGLIKQLVGESSKSDKVPEAKPTPDSIVEDAFESAAAVKLPGDLSDLDLIPGRPMLVMLRQDASGIIAVPLPKAGSSAVASVAGYRSTGLERAPAPLRVWHLLMTVGMAIVPDATSDEPISALEPDDEPNEATPMLPANAIYLWDGSGFSVASARSRDTRIVEVVPLHGVDLGLSHGTVRFIDKRTRNTMAARLIQPTICAGYGGEKGISVEDRNGRARVKFAHTDRELSGHLALPTLAEFRTNWTSRVSTHFAPHAEAIMDEAAVIEFTSTFLAMLAGKHKSDAEIAITISDGKIAFKRDKAKSTPFAAEAAGSATARVMQSDLLAVVPSLLALERTGNLSWELDPKGLLMVEVSTDAAIIRAYVQTLEEGRDTRSRSLLDRVRAPLPTSASLAETPALAA
ncbi:hypothetical protein GCM10011515_02960 [Tsuneonella deserti]|uniref:Uncharacterized protein n=2 Tax=Tsuneonella deserti TaxID=2035528 RepID=A0ABQ1RYS6_9SPHN|nr:hypothetical protein GCM10011515_02960 [Tsuneonella deserti]